MRLSEKYRPGRLAEIVGQPPIRVLRAFAQAPYAACLALEGPPGVGKTTAALALARELGCEDEFSGLRVVCCSELSVELARELMHGLRLRPMQGSGWRVLVLEELERLSPQCQVFLKVALELDLPDKAVVVATSNDSSGLQPALRQRFNTLYFQGGEAFASAGNDLLAAVWEREAPGQTMPHGWLHWGYERGENGKYSLRVALQALERALARMEVLA